MSVLESARLIATIVWIVVALTRLPNMARVLRGRPRFFDVLWSMIGAFAFLNVGFMLRWFLAANTVSLWIGLYLLSAGTGLAVLNVMTRYESTRHGG